MVIRYCKDQPNVRFTYWEDDTWSFASVYWFWSISYSQRWPQLLRTVMFCSIDSLNYSCDNWRLQNVGLLFWRHPAFPTIPEQELRSVFMSLSDQYTVIGRPEKPSILGTILPHNRALKICVSCKAHWSWSCPPLCSKHGWGLLQIPLPSRWS